MRIGIIGAGELAAALAELWATTGHQVAVGVPEGSPSLGDLIERIGPSARTATPEEAGRFGDVVVLAIPFDRPEALPSPPAVAGKIVIDAMNAVTDTGEVMDLGGRASSGIVADQLPDARIVKAFNTIQAEALRAEGRTSTPREQRPVIFLAGDDVRANATVGTLIEEIGFTPIDTGSLARGGRLQQPGSKIYNRLMLPAEARRVLQLIG